MAAVTTVVQQHYGQHMPVFGVGGGVRKCVQKVLSRGEYVLENPTILYMEILCALSAHTLPLITTLSHVVICASRSRNLASRSLATFSAAVSPGGALPRAPFFGSIGGGGVRAFGLSWVLGLGRGVLEAEYVELMGVGLA